MIGVLLIIDFLYDQMLTIIVTGTSTYFALHFTTLRTYIGYMVLRVVLRELD